jgi:hypothetical protein
MTGKDFVAGLVREGVVTPRAVVEGSLLIKEWRHRNLSYAVESTGSSPLLFKRGDGVEREANAYRWLWREDHRPLQQHLPRLYGYEPEAKRLCLELFSGCEALEDYHRRLGRFPSWIGETMGSVLGSLHSLSLDEGEAARPVAIPDWSYAVHRPTLETYSAMSAAGVQVLGLIQDRPALMGELDALVERWRPESFIHYDLKWDNCLVAPSPNTPARLKLIDWEFAGIGDPLWDTGWVLAGYLAFWIRSIPVTGEVPAAKLPELARYPLSRMYNAVRAFWRGYATMRPMEGDSLVTAVQYAAVQLLQCAFMWSASSTAADAHALLSVQLAANILQRPHQALGLLGLEDLG